ncbi:MAG: HAD family hydrolase [Phycisphaerales bacterium]|nr:HAD family hydrolase [Phycisphaerales bacterium]
MRASIQALVIFDIDGTLAQTNAIDEACYAQAVRDVLGFEGFSTDWGTYKHSTDNGILSELIGTHGRRAATLREMRAVRARFIELIAAESRSPAQMWSAVDGASAMLAQLPAMGWQVAIATGGWGPSARCKLNRVGVSIAGHAFACADDAFARLDIINMAIHRARDRKFLPDIPVIYVGDGRWDIDAARAGGYGFVGIGQGERALRLISAGSQAVLSDYRDLPKFEGALLDARQEFQRP